VFAFACKTGNFAHPKYVAMCEVAIREKKGAVAYFGSSVNSTTDTDVVIEKKLFNKTFNSNHPTLAALINSGMKQFSKSYLIRYKTIRNLKAYNLLGDPSLNLRGIKYTPTYEVTYLDPDKNVKQSEFFNPALFSVFKNPASPEFSLAYTLEHNSLVQIDLNDSEGKHIKNFLQISEQKAGVYYHDFSLSDVPAGTYQLIFKDDEKVISGKIIKK
jgi:hypothetical protein